MSNRDASTNAPTDPRPKDVIGVQHAGNRGHLILARSETYQRGYSGPLGNPTPRNAPCACGSGLKRKRCHP